MDKDEVKRIIESEYYATLAANPTWKKTLKQYTKERLKVGHDLKKAGAARRAQTR